LDNKALFQKFEAFTTSVLLVTHEMTRDVKSDAITPAQYRILKFIRVRQPVTLSQISDWLHMPMPNTSRELKKLCEKKLCEKFAVAEDRRKQNIRLSKEGEAMMHEAFKQIEVRFLQRIKDASDEDLEEINRSLEVLLSKLYY